MVLILPIEPRILYLERAAAEPMTEPRAMFVAARATLLLEDLASLERFMLLNPASRAGTYLGAALVDWQSRVRACLESAAQ